MVALIPFFKLICHIMITFWQVNLYHSVVQMATGIET